MRKITSVIVTASISLAAVSVLTIGADPASADSNGNCGGHASSNSKVLKGWSRNHTTKQIGNGPLRHAGYAAINGSVAGFVNERVVIAPLAKKARVHNYGCRSGRLFKAGMETQAKGHKMGVALPKQYDKSDVSVKSHKGWSSKIITVQAVYDTGCSNPNYGKVKIRVWIKPAPKPKTCPKGTTGHYPSCHKPTPPAPPKPPAPKPSFSCTGLSASQNGGQYGLNYTFAVSASVSYTSVTGSKYTVLNSGNSVIATPSSNTLSTNYNFPQAGTYTVQGQVITTAGTTPISSTCSTRLTISTPPPPPVTHTTSISCQVQEEITGGDASNTYCTVVSDANVPSTIKVTTSNSNQLYITGIMCTDNTTASCNGSPGHYSFVLHGINEGSQPIYPTMDVTATDANGAKDVFHTTVKVDPSCISFC